MLPVTTYLEADAPLVAAEAPSVKSKVLSVRLPLVRVSVPLHAAEALKVSPAALLTVTLLAVVSRAPVTCADDPLKV